MREPAIYHRGKMNRRGRKLMKLCLRELVRRAEMARTLDKGDAPASLGVTKALFYLPILPVKDEPHA